MKYDLLVVGAGPAGLMAARTAARDGLSVMMLDQRKRIDRIRRYCSQLIRVGSGGFRSAKTPTDMDLKPVNVTFEIDRDHTVLHLKNLGADVTVDYAGFLWVYYNQTWISPSGNWFTCEPPHGRIHGFQIDKERLSAGLLEESIAAGCEVREGLKCTAVEQTKNGVRAVVSMKGTDETLLARRAVIADGAFSALIEMLGFNEGRPSGGPILKFLTYILDRIDCPFSDSHSLHLCSPSIFAGHAYVGRWVQGMYQLGVAVPVSMQIKLPDLLETIMTDSPFASWFTVSRVGGRLGCSMQRRPAVWNPARGSIICCGDNVAYAETSIKGALGCGYKAAKATAEALDGRDGNALYNDFWQHAFSFHSEQYLGFGKTVAPVAQVLNDSEIDMLYKWLYDNRLRGLPGDVLEDNLDRLKADLPDIADKITR